MGPGADCRRGQVEHGETGVAERIFDVVAEDPQIQHVAGEVDPAVVQECAGEAMEPDDVRRDDAELAGEPIHFAPVQLELVEEDRRSQGDEGNRYDGFGA